MDLSYGPLSDCGGHCSSDPFVSWYRTGVRWGSQCTVHVNSLAKRLDADSIFPVSTGIHVNDYYRCICIYMACVYIHK